MPHPATWPYLAPGHLTCWNTEVTARDRLMKRARRLPRAFETNTVSLFASSTPCREEGHDPFTRKVP
jgi:hypothetical protein